MTERVLGVLFLAGTATPLAFSSTLISPGTTSKTFFFTAIAAIFFFVATLYVLKKKHVFVFTPITLLFILLFILLLVPNVIHDPIVNIWGDVVRMEGLYLWFFLFLFFTSAMLTMSKRWWHLYVQASVLVGTVIAIFGAIQYSNMSSSTVRIDIFFGNPMFLAQYLLLISFFSLYLLNETRSTIVRYYLGIAFALQIVAIILTGTRGSFLGLCAGLFIFFGYVLFMYRSTFFAKKNLTPLLICCSVIFFVFIILVQTSFVSENRTLARITNISISDLTQSERFYLWDAGVKGLLGRPVFGWGIEGFGTVHDTYMDPVVYNKGVIRYFEPWHDRPHNVFLHIGVSGGVFALLSFVALLLFGFYGVFKSNDFNNTQKASLFGLIVAYCVSGFFGIDTISSYIVLFSILGLIHAHWNHAVYTKSFFIHNPTVRKSISVFCGAVMICSLIIVIHRVSFAHEFRSVVDMYPKNSIERVYAIGDLLSHVQFITGDTVFALEELVESAVFALSFEMHSEKDVEHVNQIIRDSTLVIRDTKNMSAKEHFFYGRYFRIIGDMNQSIDHLNQAAVLAPKRIHILLELAHSYIYNNEPQKALAVLETALEINPQYEPAQKMYAVALIHAGEIEKGRTYLRDHFESSLLYDVNILIAYLAAGLEDNAVLIAREKLKQDPDALFAWNVLLFYYNQVGDNEAFDQTIENMLELNPSFGGHSENLVKKLESNDVTVFDIAVIR